MVGWRIEKAQSVVDNMLGGNASWLRHGNWHDWAMEDDYMGFVTSTLMYVMRERVLRDEIQKLKDPYKERHTHQLLFTLWPSLKSMWPNNLSPDAQYDPSIETNAKPNSYRVMQPLAKLALLWPCVHKWITDGSHYHYLQSLGIQSRLEHWLLQSYRPL